MRYNSHKALSDEFVSQMLKELNIYQAKNSTTVLPDCLSEKSVKNLYLTLISQKDLSQSSQEMVLYLLKAKNLHKEAFDFASQQADSELTKFYKAEALLNLKLKSGTSYESAVK